MVKIEEFRAGMACVRRRVYSEDALQIACKSWFDLHHPECSLLLHHSPNEGRLFMRDRDGAKRKAMGVRAGFPDFVLLLPRGGYPYLCVELKSAKGRQSPSQKAYEAAVVAAGGCYRVVRSLDEFIAVVGGYLVGVV